MTRILSNNNSRLLAAPESDPLEGGRGVIVQNYCHCISWGKSDNNRNATFQNAVFPVLLGRQSDFKEGPLLTLFSRPPANPPFDSTNLVGHFRLPLPLAFFIAVFARKGFFPGSRCIKR